MKYASTAAVGMGGTDSWRRGRRHRRADGGSSLTMRATNEASRNSVPVVGEGAAHTSMASANLIARNMRRGDQARSGTLLLTLSTRRGGSVRRRFIVMMGVQRVAACSAHEECLEAGGTGVSTFVGQCSIVLCRSSGPGQQLFGTAKSRMSEFFAARPNVIGRCRRVPSIDL